VRFCHLIFIFDGGLLSQDGLNNKQ
jgi:hypothetical protein